MFLVDLEAGADRRRRGAQARDRLGQALRQVAAASTWSRWPTCRQAPDVPGPDPETLLHRQMAFGYTLEDLKFILGPMGATGEEAIGSMGTDTPLAVLSDRAQPLFNYFKQLFAQVTNPPLDAIREELVTSVFTGAGGEGNLLDAHARSLPPDRARHPDPRQRRAGAAQAARRLARASSRRRCPCSSWPPTAPRAWSESLRLAVRPGLRGDRATGPT